MPSIYIYIYYLYAGHDIYCVCGYAWTLTTTTMPIESRTTPPTAAPTADTRVVSMFPVWEAPVLLVSLVGVGLVGCGGWEMEAVTSGTEDEGCTN